MAGVSPGVFPHKIDLFLCHKCNQIWIVLDFHQLEIDPNEDYMGLSQLKMDLNEKYMGLLPAENRP